MIESFKVSKSCILKENFAPATNNDMVTKNSGNIHPKKLEPPKFIDAWRNDNSDWCFITKHSPGLYFETCFNEWIAKEVPQWVFLSLPQISAFLSMQTRKKCTQVTLQSAHAMGTIFYWASTSTMLIHESPQLARVCSATERRVSSFMTQGCLFLDRKSYLILAKFQFIYLF